jgi:hypothetical protein
MSSLAWIDFDEAERQRAQRIVALFQERESRDELGLGAIRDSIADRLFPERARFRPACAICSSFPGCFACWKAGTFRKASCEPRRALEIRLADALKRGGETNGVIGRDAGPRLQRQPSSAYWAGLGAWKTRQSALVLPELQGAQAMPLEVVPPRLADLPHPNEASSLTSTISMRLCLGHGSGTLSDWSRRSRSLPDRTDCPIPKATTAPSIARGCTTNTCISSPRWTHSEFGMRKPVPRTSSLQKRVKKRIKKTAAHGGSEFDFPKLAGSVGGRMRITDQPPLIFHPEITGTAGATTILDELFRNYRESLHVDRRILLDRYRLAFTN